MVRVYGIKNCDSVKKALKFLKEHAVDFEFIDFKEQPPTLQQIQAWLQKSDIKKLFNSRSTSYRELKLKEKNLSDDEKVLWMNKEYRLIKRPVIEKDEILLVGFNEDEYKRILL